MNDLFGKAVRITGVAVITATGDRLGTVSDIGFDARGRVLGGPIGQRFVPSEQIQSVGKDAIIVTTMEFERSLGDEHEAAV